MQTAQQARHLRTKGAVVQLLTFAAWVRRYRPASSRYIARSPPPT